MRQPSTEVPPHVLLFGNAAAAKKYNAVRIVINAPKRESPPRAAAQGYCKDSYNTDGRVLEKYPDCKSQIVQFSPMQVGIKF